MYRVHPFRNRFSAARHAVMALALIVLAIASPAGAETGAKPDSAGKFSFATIGNDPFALGERVFFGGFSAGTFGIYGSSTIPPMNAGLDFAFHKYLTAGGIFAFSRYDYRSESLTYLMLAGRGTYHPTFWFQEMTVPLDPYAVLTCGYAQAIWSGPGTYDYSYVVLGPGLGARYWFMPDFAGQAELGLGSGLSLANIGLSYKF